jgi:HEAT repeat protein
MAHPRLLALLGTTGQPNPVTVIQALPGFARPESIPLLLALLLGGRANVRMSAADALGRHPLPEARAALEAALRSDDAEATRFAADGLRVRGDASSCPALIERLDHPDSSARYAVLSAVAALGCLSSQALAERVRGDSDPDIRGLADRELQK